MITIEEKSRRNELLPLHDKKVVEHNDLITSVAKMDKVPLKIFELAVSYIDVENPPENHTVYLSKKSLFAFFNVSDNGKHSRFKEAVERMQKQAYFVIKQENEKQGVYFESIVPIPYVRWNDYNDEVTIEFNHHIMPYLIDLKTNFTQYAIADIMDLNSKHSVVLYKWLSMNYNQYDHYKDENKRTKEQLESYKNPTITMEDLRYMTDTEKEYTRFFNFETRVLKVAQEEINEHTHFRISYEKIKKGRSISAIKFFITKKEVPANLYYKEEQQDPVYLQTKEQREKERTQKFLQAQKSVYTQTLISVGLFEFMDVLDNELMIEMFDSVFPKYDELAQLRSGEEVTRHLKYVKEHQEGYSKVNKSKYLRVAIEDYLKTVKR